MLEIRTGKSEKKGIRVDLFRRYRVTDEATQKGAYKYKRLGSFHLDSGVDAALLELLDRDEILDLKNWLAEVEFAKQFKIDPEELEKINLHLPPTFHEAIKKLSLEAKRANIDFVINGAILDSLLKTAKLVQNKIDKINGFSSNILENVGINTEIEKLKVESGDKELFRALLKLDQPIGQTCSELEREALKLGKNKKIPPPLLNEWAGLGGGLGAEKKVNNWCYFIAGEVLLKHGINPCEIIPPENFVNYWAIIKKNQLDFDDALKQFKANFNIQTKAQIEQTIAMAYKN